VARANADIGFTELQSPSLDTTPADLAGMALPTLVLAGSASHPSFRSVARDLATVLPDARLGELYGRGHVTYAERPDEFENAVSASPPSSTAATWHRHERPDRQGGRREPYQ